jgi:hypothetical protein
VRFEGPHYAAAARVTSMVKHQRGARVYALVCAAMFTPAAINTLPAANGTSPGRDSQLIPATTRLRVPVEYYKLSNGLKVVLSQDATTNGRGGGVLQDRGFRTEPRNRTSRPALGLAYRARSPDARVVRLRPPRSRLAHGQIHCSTALVREGGFTGQLQAGINWGRGNMFDYSGPML